MTATGTPSTTAELVNGEDARVRQRGDRARFGFETPAHLGIGGDVRRHDLDRDVAVEPRVAGAIDLAHAARTRCGSTISYCARRAPAASVVTTVTCRQRH